jgi:hypothetical protein
LELGELGACFRVSEAERRQISGRRAGDVTA